MVTYPNIKKVLETQPYRKLVVSNYVDRVNGDWHVAARIVNTYWCDATIWEVAHHYDYDTVLGKLDKLIADYPEGRIQ